MPSFALASLKMWIAQKRKKQKKRLSEDVKNGKKNNYYQIFFLVLPVGDALHIAVTKPTNTTTGFKLYPATFLLYQIIANLIKEGIEVFHFIYYCTARCNRRNEKDIVMLAAAAHVLER